MTCHGILGRIFGHKYRPRYDVKERENPNPLPWNTVYLAKSFSEPARPFYVFTNSIYICDVCVRCGDRIERGPHGWVC